MREAHQVERAVGMRYYASDVDGIGGRLRTAPEDFRVRELEAMDVQPVEADASAYPHLVCRVTLRNWDTNDFARALSNRLGMSRERISWAGTKDKRAVTTQLISIDRVEPDALPSLDGVDLEVVGRAGRPVLFGDLLGNEFEVRVVEPTRTDVDEITEELATFADAAPPTVGIPNYFGQQRFGSRRPVTHKVGLAIARGDWEQAVMEYVGSPHPREPAETRDARRYIDETRDWAEGLERLPKHLRFERAMLHRLAEGTDERCDFQAALEAVPTNLQQLFIHAAQSYVFNLIVSARLERGLPFAEPVQGDVICFVDDHGGLAVPDTDRLQRVTADRIDVLRRHNERGRITVTAPLVGTETDLGEGEPGDVERTVLSSVGIEPSDFDLPGEFHSTGDRRAVLTTTTLTVEAAPLSLSFSLPRGSYATVLLREYLKVDPECL